VAKNVWVGEILGKKIRILDEDYQQLLERFNWNNRKLNDKDSHDYEFYIPVPCPFCIKWRNEEVGRCNPKCPAKVSSYNYFGCMDIFAEFGSCIYFQAFTRKVCWGSRRWREVRGQLNRILDWLHTFKRMGR